MNDDQKHHPKSKNTKPITHPTSHPSTKPIPKNHDEKIEASHSPNSQKKSLLSHWPMFVAALLIIAGGTWFYFNHEEQEEAQKKAASHKAPPQPVETAVVDRGDLNIYVRALGTAVPLQTVTVTARVQGQITKIQYNEGQLVKKGDPLLEIDPRPYRAAVLQGEGQLAHDEAALYGAQLTLKRYRLAFARQAVSRQQLDDQIQLVRQYQGSVKSDQGNLDNARVNLDYCEIKSPIDGRVGLRLVDLGNVVQAGANNPLVVITQLQPIAMVFSVPQADLTEVQKNYRPNMVMPVDAFDRTSANKLASGKFLTFDNQVDTTTGTVRLKAIFDNTKNELFPNEFVNARLLAEQRHGVLLVPTIAIQHGSQGAFVYSIAEGNTVKISPVQIGASEGDESEIIQGLQPNDIVAISAFDKLQDGGKVKILNEGPALISGTTTAPHAVVPAASTNSPATGPVPAAGSVK